MERRGAIRSHRHAVVADRRRPHSPPSHFGALKTLRPQGRETLRGRPPGCSTSRRACAILFQSPQFNNALLPNWLGHGRSLRPRYRSTGVRYSRLCCGRGGLPDALPPVMKRSYGFRTAVQRPSVRSTTLTRPLPASPSIHPAIITAAIMGLAGFPSSASKLSSM